MSKQLQIAVCMVAGVVAGGCQATEKFFSRANGKTKVAETKQKETPLDPTVVTEEFVTRSGSKAKVAETIPSDIPHAPATSPPPLDPRVLDRLGVESGSRQAGKLAGEEARARAF